MVRMVRMKVEAMSMILNAAIIFDSASDTHHLLFIKWLHQIFDYHHMDQSQRILSCSNKLSLSLCASVKLSHYNLNCLLWISGSIYIYPTIIKPTYLSVICSYFILQLNQSFDLIANCSSISLATWHTSQCHSTLCVMPSYAINQHFNFKHILSPLTYLLDIYINTSVFLPLIFKLAGVLRCGNQQFGEEVEVGRTGKVVEVVKYCE